jgi:hypothetical protein
MPLIARRRCRAVICALVVLARPDGAVVAAPCWPPPVVAPVTDPFREPECRWCPGNRGIEYGTAAGTTYVVVRHADGLRLTYGNLEPVEVAQGDVVARGTRLGVTAGRFHLGLRDGERYVDPAPFLGVERRVVRLVPVDGSAANPSPLPRLVCGAGPSP